MLSTHLLTSDLIPDSRPRPIPRIVPNQNPPRVSALAAMKGQSPGLTHALAEAEIVARHDITVLLTGEPGTGKTMLARALHQASARATGPFVEVSCPNLPASLLENELFGRERGAYTDGGGRETGKVAAADGGTLFLDELGDLPVSAQAKLLMLLNDRIYYPLGARNPVRANVRILAATNRALEPAIKDGLFRRDLFDRVSEMTIEMPPLRDRLEDLETLANHLTLEACRDLQLPSMTLVPAALRILRSREWPGNLRELRNRIRMATLRADAAGTQSIEPRHLFPDNAVTRTSAPVERPTLASAARQAQRDLLFESLRVTNWNVTKTARRLEASRSHVNNLISQFGLRRPGARNPQSPQNDSLTL